MLVPIDYHACTPCFERPIHPICKIIMLGRTKWRVVEKHYFEPCRAFAKHALQPSLLLLNLSGFDEVAVQTEQFN
jgi:hypothetical protein